jgi:hypothetical protein
VPATRSRRQPPRRVFTGDLYRWRAADETFAAEWDEAIENGTVALDDVAQGFVQRRWARRRARARERGTSPAAADALRPQVGALVRAQPPESLQLTRATDSEAADEWRHPSGGRRPREAWEVILEDLRDPIEGALRPLRELPIKGILSSTRTMRPSLAISDRNTDASYATTVALGGCRHATPGAKGDGGQVPLERAHRFPAALAAPLLAGQLGRAPAHGSGPGGPPCGAGQR